MNLFKNFLSISVFCFIAFSVFAQDNSEYINPFLGVDSKGNTFPGAALPFSMVKLGPDVWMPARWSNSNSGYASGRPVYGFSHTHVSGTGGGAKYGHFQVMPTTGDINVRDISAHATDETARPGYYAATLDNGVRCELTLTPSVGFHRYTATGQADSLRLLFDVSSLLDKGSTPQHLLASGVEIISDNELVGYCCSEGGWNVGAPFTVYFYAKLDRPAAAFGTFRQGRLSPSNRMEESINSNDHTAKAAYLCFPVGQEKQVELKCAISYISVEKAKENFQNEAANITFDEAAEQAASIWAEYAGRLRVKCDDPEILEMIYSGLYRSLLMPARRTGEMPGWESDETYYDDYYAIWDTYRTCTPLVTLIAPDKVIEQVNALINIGLHEGYMPDARSGNSSGLTQGGSNCDVMIADAFVKGLEGIDYRKALDLMRRNAEVEPDRPRFYGRGGTEQYDTLGYVSASFERSGSRQMEYAYCDYAIYEVAKGLGEPEIAERYRARSGYWRNLWNGEAESCGVRGFIWPRDEKGGWVDDYDPLETGIWTKAFYEGSSWQYSFFVPHDVAGLIECCGGREAFIDRLDTFFDKGIDGKISGFYNVGNEPSFLIPCLYIWAGRYDLTARRVRQIIDTYFGAGRDGLPGNDDSGAMGSWCTFHLLGLYPNAGQDYYLLTSPAVDEAEFRFPDGKSFRIVVRNQAPDHIYIQTARLNGKRIDRAWIKHDEIISGGTLELTMGSEPSSFGRRHLPPSLSIGE